MAETEIARTQVITIKKVWEGNVGEYEYLFWSDQDGKEYKIPAKRKEYFEDVIIQNAAVQLNYAKYKGKEYIYSAESVRDKLPTSTPKDEKLEVLKEEQGRKGDPIAKNDPQRKSIERQTALKAAVELAKGMEGSTPQTVLMDAKMFEVYLEFGYVRPPDKLVEEAKKLGGEEE